MSKLILGMSCSHNGAMAIGRDQEVVVAIQEERLSGIKRDRLDAGNPSFSLGYCLHATRASLSDIDLIVSCSVNGATSIQNEIFLNPEFLNIEKVTIPHHYGHALSTYFNSGFDESLILVIDGAGSPYSDLLPEEKEIVGPDTGSLVEIASLYFASGTRIHPIKKYMAKWWFNNHKSPLSWFGSLGTMYMAVANQLFRDRESGKVMGLAPYGHCRYPVSDFVEFNNNEIQFTHEISKYFTQDMTWKSHPKECADLAASVQQALEVSIMSILNDAKKLSNCKSFCFAGGVALNSVMNEKIARSGLFEDYFFLPPAEDSGVALGAVYHGMLNKRHSINNRKLRTDGFGYNYTSEEIRSALSSIPGITWVEDENYINTAATLLANGKILGWFDGKSELGPRALGSRSILCDPRRNDAKEILNSRVKHRESFRPFAPSILQSEVKNWFETAGGEYSPFMLRVMEFKQESLEKVPAVCHVDNTGRVQTLTEDVNGAFYRLVHQFYKITGVPIVLNTSFNVMGEPIVETPEDAVWCLLGTGIDCCIFPGLVVRKTNQSAGIMDLIPSLNINKWVVENKSNGQIFQLELDSDSRFYFDVSKKWGKKAVRIDFSEVDIFEKIDGSKTLRELFLELKSEDPDVTENQFKYSILLLRRLGLLKLASTNS